MNKITVYTASWCPSCQTLKKSLEDSNIEYETVDVDTDEGMALATNSGVRGLPTTIITDDQGAVIRNIVGLQPVGEYMKYTGDIK